VIEPTIDECFAAGKGPKQSVPYSEGGVSNTPEERARFEAYMRGHCWGVGNYDESLKGYDTVIVRMLYGVWRDRGALCKESHAVIQSQPVERRFNMQNGPTIPWSLAEVLYAGYSACYGTQQTLERLNERGGFGWEEIAVMWKDTHGMGGKFRKATERAIKGQT